MTRVGHRNSKNDPVGVVQIILCILNRVSVTVAVVGSRVEAELIVGMLRNHGIKAHASADDLGGVDPALQAQGVRILVPDTDREAARELLDNSPQNSPPTKPLNAFQRWLITMLGGNK